MIDRETSYQNWVLFSSLEKLTNRLDCYFFDYSLTKNIVRSKKFQTNYGKMQMVTRERKERETLRERERESERKREREGTFESDSL